MALNSFNDNISGASELMRGAARLLIKALQNNSSAQSSEQALEKGAETILSAQPRMAPLYRLVGLTLECWQQNKDNNNRNDIVIREIESVMEQEKQAGQCIAQRCFALLNQKTLGLYSRSGVILDTLLAAKQEKIDFKVVVTEARPNLEGKKSALQLADAGIDTTLMVDAAFDYLTEHCDMIWVGADRISQTEVTNKIGTKALTLLAGHAHKPVYVITTERKFLPDSVDLPQEPRHPGREISDECPEHLSVWNKYFEQIPLGWFTRVITQSGLLSVAGVRQKIESIDSNAIRQWMDR